MTTENVVYGLLIVALLMTVWSNITVTRAMRAIDRARDEEEKG